MAAKRRTVASTNGGLYAPHWLRDWFRYRRQRRANRRALRAGHHTDWGKVRAKRRSENPEHDVSDAGAGWGGPIGPSNWMVGSVSP
jgi:hypothetical protein